MTTNSKPKIGLGIEPRATGSIDQRASLSHREEYAKTATDNEGAHSDKAVLIHNKLLPEIMSYIFELCVHSQWEKKWEVCIFEGRRAYPSGYFKPLSLGAVCQDWRNIVCFTHGLWNRVFIFLDNTPEIEHERVRTWLTRSGNHPLSLYVVSNNDFTETPLTESRLSLIKTLNQHSSRWSHLFLYGSCKWMAQVCASIPKDPSNSLLKTLKLMPSINAGDLNAVFPSKTVLPPDFSLFLKNKRECSIKDLNIDWSTVTHLELTHVRATEWMDILEGAPRLISFSIEDFNNTSRNQLTGTPFVHRSLQSLEFRSRHSEFNPYIYALPHVTFPELKHLHCEFMASHTDSTRTLEFLTSFIERSGCSLKSLSLIDISSSDQELIRLLDATPALEDLRVTQPFWLEAEGGKLLGPFWDYIGTTTSTFLPNLRSLHYTSRLPGIPWTRFPGIFGDIDKMLAKEHRRPLHTLTIVSCTPPPVSDSAYVDSEAVDEPLGEEGPDMDLIDRDTVARFMQLKRAGMTIDVYNAFDRTQDLLKRSMDIHEAEK